MTKNCGLRIVDCGFFRLRIAEFGLRIDEGNAVFNLARTLIVVLIRMTRDTLFFCQSAIRNPNSAIHRGRV
jgi:hypothetical protein